MNDIQPFVAVGMLAFFGTLGAAVVTNEWRRLRSCNKALRETIDKVCKERDEYATSYQGDQAALRFYADPMNWKSAADKKHSSAVKDRGRAALKALGLPTE